MDLDQWVATSALLRNKEPAKGKKCPYWRALGALSWFFMATGCTERIYYSTIMIPPIIYYFCVCPPVYETVSLCQSRTSSAPLYSPFAWKYFLCLWRGGVGVTSIIFQSVAQYIHIHRSPSVKLIILNHQNPENKNPSNSSGASRPSNDKN